MIFDFGKDKCFNLFEDFKFAEPHAGATLNKCHNKIHMKYCKNTSDKPSPGFRVLGKTKSDKKYFLKVKAKGIYGSDAFIYVETLDGDRLLPRDNKFCVGNGYTTFELNFTAESDKTYFGILFFCNDEDSLLNIKEFICKETKNDGCKCAYERDNEVNIIPCGTNNIASGGNSTVVNGTDNNASGSKSVAMGLFTKAIGDQSVAMGESTIADGRNAVAMNLLSKASGIYSVAMGSDTETVGNNSVAMGLSTRALGNESVAMGIATSAIGNNSVTMGVFTNVEGNNSVAMGILTTVSGIASLAVGNDTKIIGATRASSFACGFASDGGTFEISGFGAGSIACGLSINNGQLGATSFGSAVFGVANGTGSYHSANANGTMVVGRGVVSTEDFSLAVGDSYEQSDVGTTGMNLPKITLGASTDPAGSSNDLGQAVLIQVTSPSDGGTEALGRIITNNITMGQADYAEYFEWDDGNILDSDRDGYFASMNGKMIRFAENDTDVIGVTNNKVYGTSGIVGDAAEKAWHANSLKDDLGRLIVQDNYKYPLRKLFLKYQVEMTPEVINFLDSKEDHDPTIITEILDLDLHINSSYLEMSGMTGESADNAFNLNQLTTEISNLRPIQVSVQNPDYDPNITYIPRSERPEWTLVSMLGKIYVRDNGNCQVGDKCSCGSGGIAIPGTKWRIIDRRSANVIRILLTSA